ncbi:DUF4178 domain-containing protein [Cognatishimia sp. F0-27]|uniref:DUF4178 domain-containing protein n=1 Tax=Cognatishimia sp. F0-27 TaxID=2816855 RepID=UPI001D0C15E4|nr:DUF4178 domain-containing protein [Cognatishimia sp. F0-27]MCC1493233.1 DUF4178 domain-containing protein [Cognatishimia sp. F0-27]
MSRAPDIKAIDCATCGAGLDVLGGGRVTTHICPYCGTALDALDGYRALKKFSDAPRPETPFSIGMSGTLYGVEWTVIGLLGHRERWAGKVWEWVDHQLYSPTHGYAWLTLEDGHLTFARRVRGTPASVWMSSTGVEASENPPSVFHDGRRYKYLSTTVSTVFYAEGEFTWAPQFDDRTTAISALADDEMLDFAETGQEREVHRVVYLDGPSALAAFRLPETTLRPKGVHPTQPYHGWKEAAFLRNAALGFAAVALAIGLILAIMPGRLVLEPTTVGLNQLPRDVSFRIDAQADKLAGLYFSANVSNSWAYIDLELTDPNDEVLFEAGRTMEYYFGRDSDGSWSEGSRSASLHFLPTVPGEYTLSIGGVEQGLWGSGGRSASWVQVSARTGMSSGYYPMVLAVLLGMLALVLSAGSFIHNRRRWAHSDWSDED